MPLPSVFCQKISKRHASLRGRYLCSPVRDRESMTPSHARGQDSRSPALHGSRQVCPHFSCRNPLTAVESDRWGWRFNVIHSFSKSKVRPVVWGPWFWWEIPSKVGGFPCNPTISTLLPASRHTGQKRNNKYLLHPCPSLQQEMDKYNISVLLSTPKTVVTPAPGESKKGEGISGKAETTGRLAGWQRLRGETFWRRKQPQPSPSNDQLKAILLPRAGEDSKWGLRGAAPGRALHDNWWEGEAGGGSPIPPLTMVIRYSKCAR